jgi:hypothetical protein
MIPLTQAAASAALLTFAAASQLDAQGGSVSLTLSRGPHVGSYRFPAAQCDVFGGRGEPASISLVTPAMQQGGPADPASIPSVDLAVEEGTGGHNGLAIDVEFRAPGGSRERNLYRVYAIPPELQAGPKKPPEGRGEVTIRRTENGVTATFRAETNGGVRIEGTLECGT